VTHEAPFLFARTAAGSLAIEREMVTFGGASGLSLVEESFVIGHLLLFPVDLDPIPELVDLHLFSDEPFGDAVAVGVHMYITLHIHSPIESLVDRRDIGGKALEKRLFHHIGSVGAHAERAFSFAVGRVHAPFSCLGVEVLPVCEGASCQEVVLDIGKISFYPGLSIGIAHSHESMRSRMPPWPGSSWLAS